MRKIVWSSMALLCAGCVEGVEAPTTMEIGPGPDRPEVGVVGPIDFGEVGLGQTAVASFSVQSRGAAPLLVTSVWPGEDASFVVVRPPDVFEPIAPWATLDFEVRYTPTTSDPSEAVVRISTNAGPVVVPVRGRVAAPCIDVVPGSVQLGGVVVGHVAQGLVEVSGCSATLLEVTGVELAASSSPAFSVAWEDAVLTVTYEPTAVTGATDVGILVITSNAGQTAVEVSGLGVETPCPFAVGVIPEGGQVIPQTILHLSGDQSFAHQSALAAWKWSVVQPVGSASVFVPSDTFPNPIFGVNAAGEYEFRLEVWDEAGVKSCLPWTQTVLVVPDQAIHVELLWHTPSDPDGTDQGPEAGADLDLHFTHDAYAQSGPDIDQDGVPDGWFDQPFDCFWFNAHPNWGSFDPSIDDDPGLDRDDTDGAGPENLNLNFPESTVYRIGVHYWSDHGYGASLATVRVYVFGELVYEAADVRLVDHDLWDVATVDWPSGQVAEVQLNGDFEITPNYQNPSFFNP